MVRQTTSGRYALEDAGDHLRLRWSADITVDSADVASVSAEITVASPEGPRPLLMYVSLVGGITAEAKQLLIRNTRCSRIAIVGIDDIGRILTAFTHRSVTPTGYFTDDTAAREWLLDDTHEHPSIFGESYGVQHAFVSEMRGGVLWVRWTQAFHITEKIAENLLARAEFMNPTTCPPLLLELHEMLSASEGAMKILADGLNITALAVVSADPSGRTLTSFYRQRARPPYKTSYFTTAEEARHWLAGHPSPPATD
ncbi:hypothetical protein ASF21_11615 [Arthrobacter sp. Leaf234]|nr:hypothetical protein ASF21_11615 [Arthrobacter sp. Leaf234]